MVNRKIYTKEFKEQAVQLIKTSDQPVSKIAKDLGLNANMLRRWRDELKEFKDCSFPGQGHRSQGPSLKKKIVGLKKNSLLLKWSVTS